MSDPDELDLHLEADRIFGSCGQPDCPGHRVDYGWVNSAAED